MWDELYRKAFVTELKKIAAENKLISSTTPKIPKVLSDFKLRNANEAKKKHHSGVGANATPVERRHHNVLKKSNSIASLSA